MQRSPPLPIFLLALLVACEEPPERPLDPRLEVVASGLVVPWAMDFTPDGRILIAERSGYIRVVGPDGLQPAPWAAVPARDGTLDGDDTGLLGLAVAPDFATSRTVFVCYTWAAEDAAGTERLYNRVARLRELSADTAAEVGVVLDSLPAADRRNGCKLGFGPDGRLYVALGDAQADSTAQSTEALTGKILRLEPDGSVPADNPFRGSPIWSLGHRDPQGLTWDAATATLYETERGFVTGETQFDELNRIARGGNYGWPQVHGAALGSGLEAPLTDAYMSPTGIAFVSSELYPEWQGRLLIGGSSSEGLYVATLNDGVGALIERLPWVQVGRVRAVAQGRDGHIYLLTSNRDGRGRAGQYDDRLLRIRPN